MTLECRRLKEQIRIQLQSDRTSAGGGGSGGACSGVLPPLTPGGRLTVPTHA